jgi:hypothetical protein
MTRIMVTNNRDPPKTTDIRAQFSVYSCQDLMNGRGPIQGVLSTYKLTQRSTDHIQKLKVHQLVKKWPAFYGTRKVINTFTTARRLSPCSSRWIQSKKMHKQPNRSGSSPPNPHAHCETLYRWCLCASHKAHNSSCIYFRSRVTPPFFTHVQNTTPLKCQI